MTYNVFSGTLSPNQSITQAYSEKQKKQTNGRTDSQRERKTDN